MLSTKTSYGDKPNVDSIAIISMSAVPVTPMLHDEKVNLAELFSWNIDVAHRLSTMTIFHAYDARTGINSVLLPGQHSAISGTCTVEWLVALEAAVAECMGIEDLSMLRNSDIFRSEVAPPSPSRGHPSCDTTTSPSPAPPKQPSSPGRNNTQLQNNSSWLEDAINSTAEVRVSRTRRAAPAPAPAAVSKSSKALRPRSIICKASQTTSATRHPKRHVGKPARYV